MKNNIIIVSDDIDEALQIKSKLFFLRRDDKVCVTNFAQAKADVKLRMSEVVLILADGEKTLELLKELRKNDELCLILVAKTYDADYVLAAYDNGADDFILSDAEESEFVIRIVNNIKHNSVKISANRDKKLLEQLNVINAETGFYQNSYAKQVMRNYIDGNLLTEGLFMAFTCAEDFLLDRLVDAIKLSVRVNDVVCYGHDKFYVLLPSTDVNGALVVLNKIKEFYGEDLQLNAGLADIGEFNSSFEKEAVKALNEAVATNAEYVYASSHNEEDGWLEETKDTEYKFFRQIFNKKLSNVIVPVFEDTKKVFEERMCATEIEYVANEEHCVFSLKNKNFESELRIEFLGQGNVVIKIAHSGLNSPENSDFSLSLPKLKYDELSDILSTFGKEFKDYEVM